jgi:hypothetical protein
LAALGYVEYLSDFYFQIGIKLRFQYYECWYASAGMVPTAWFHFS